MMRFPGTGFRRHSPGILACRKDQGSRLAGLGGGSGAEAGVGLTGGDLSRTVMRVVDMVRVLLALVLAAGSTATPGCGGPG